MTLSAPVRSRRPAAARQPARAVAPPRRAGKVVESRSRRSTRGVRRSSAVVAGTIVVTSLLATVAANAYLTQGQVRLARLQQQVAVQINAHRDLELQVAQLEDPSHLVAQAERQGLNAPSQVGDLAQVDLSVPFSLPTPAGAGAARPKTTATVTPSGSAR